MDEEFVSVFKCKKNGGNGKTTRRIIVLRLSDTWIVKLDNLKNPGIRALKVFIPKH
jgi:hypothetical protein